MIGGNYQLVFPQDDDPAAVGYGWEFDRSHSVFVTVNLTGRMIDLNPRPPYRSLLPQFVQLHEQHSVDELWGEEGDDVKLVNAAERLHLGDETLADRLSTRQISEELFTSFDYRREVYISACIRNDVNELRQIFQKYPEDDFLSHVSDEGDNGVLYAATGENGLATVEWLHKKGAAITHSNHYGRTPLMEAALWGRLEIVRYLTAHGVDVQARDGNGMNALALAMNSERNTGERASRVQSNYRELVHMDKQRARVEQHLKQVCNAHLHPSGAEDPSRRGSSFFQRTADGHFVLYRPRSFLLVPNGQPQKAFAELDRGPSYPLVTAMSGYTYSAWPNVLDNNQWAYRADELREYIGLSRNVHAASHVEPQLLTYLLFHHTLIDITDGNEDFEQAQLQNILNGLLPLRPTPIITVNKPGFCPSCLEFFNEYRRIFHVLDVQFRFVGENAHGTL
jgi:hypothetical protein